MAPKKKKTQLKPVARGFATTSVPKKVVEPPKEPDTSEAKGDASEPTNGHPPDSTVAGEAPKSQDCPTLSATDQALQNFIDKFQDKVEKEIVRTVKVCIIEAHYCVAVLMRT